MRLNSGEEKLAAMRLEAARRGDASRSTLAQQQDKAIDELTARMRQAEQAASAASTNDDERSPKAK